jgi:hypothetical protein
MTILGSVDRQTSSQQTNTVPTSSFHSRARQITRVFAASANSKLPSRSTSNHNYLTPQDAHSPNEDPHAMKMQHTARGSTNMSTVKFHDFESRNRLQTKRVPRCYPQIRQTTDLKLSGNAFFCQFVCAQLSSAHGRLNGRRLPHRRHRLAWL